MPTAKRTVSIWILAIVSAAAAMVYQRLTGPTHPLRGSAAIGEEELSYRLIRSASTSEDARVAVPHDDAVLGGTLYQRRFKTDDAFTPRPMSVEGAGEERELVAHLPAQPAAAKLEYYIELATAAGTRRLPDTPEGTVVIRFKDDVPAHFLLSHVAMMILAIVLGIRTGVGAIFDPHTLRRYAWTTLVVLTAGGMILGPIVQKHAFGEYWTGFPNGYDLTDNKTLIMWGCWLLACLAIGRRPRRREGLSRLVMVAATAIMLAVYLVPHSLRGSELDWEKLDQGVTPQEAIGTGD